MNFSSEKYNLPVDEERRVDGAEGASTSPKLKTDLTDNIFAYDTLYIPKKAKVNPMNSGIRKSTPKAGSFNRV